MTITTIVDQTQRKIVHMLLTGDIQSLLIYWSTFDGDKYGNTVTVNTSDIANELSLDCESTYRLLRALGSLGFLKEEANSNDNSNRFSLTPRGKLLTKDHPQYLRGMSLLEIGLEHYVI